MTYAEKYHLITSHPAAVSKFSIIMFRDSSSVLCSQHASLDRVTHFYHVELQQHGNPHTWFTLGRECMKIWKLENEDIYVYNCNTFINEYAETSGSM